MITRLEMQFRNVERYVIRGVIKRHKGDADAAINEIAWIDNKYKGSSAAPSPKLPGTPPTRPNPASSPGSSPVFLPQPPRHHPVEQPPSPPPKIGKPKKNEHSRIYANREQGATTKRRDPDESESEAGVSEAESEMDWSGDEGHRKRKRKGNEEDEVDAEGAALKAFNEVDVDRLTGTIGE